MLKINTLHYLHSKHHKTAIIKFLSRCRILFKHCQNLKYLNFRCLIWLSNSRTLHRCLTVWTHPHLLGQPHFNHQLLQIYLKWILTAINTLNCKNKLFFNSMWFKCKLKLLSFSKLRSSKIWIKVTLLLLSKWFPNSQFLIWATTEQLLEIPVWSKILIIQIFQTFPPIIINSTISSKTKNNQVTISVLKKTKENQRKKNKEAFSKKMGKIKKFKLSKAQYIIKKTRNLISHKMKNIKTKKLPKR
jgi:hypothetical protein